MKHVFNERFNTANDRIWFDAELNNVLLDVFRFQFIQIHQRGELIFNLFSDPGIKNRKVAKTPEDDLQGCRRSTSTIHRSRTASYSAIRAIT